ncbi:expressed unknown protein [Seminavis robusta]|uniref:Uncharacterized protein n=1 Tax=Seminavis robusta TaxID=568900 RepID=A0A9N8HJG5_9STRA|nr:expressed unknown protein [Seminavis robusta]|eukprot:Sro551_g164930.1 n/a (280) ;mRNA; f:44002-44841
MGRPAKTSCCCYLIRFLWLAACLVVTVQAQQSGCGVCASTGDCSHAFKGNPGQFCGTFFSKQQSTAKPCCCPVQSSCKLGPDTCQCHVSGNSSSNSSSSGGNSNGTTTDLTGIVLFVIATCVVVGCCYKGCCQKQEPKQVYTGPVFVEEEVQPSAPVETDPLAPPPATNPSYAATAPTLRASNPSSGPAFGRTYTNPAGLTARPTYRPTGIGNWLAGGLGIATGAAAGSLVTHQLDTQRETSDSHRYGDDPYGSGIGGGHDIAGDTGDDDGGVDIEGDS